MAWREAQSGGTYVELMRAQTELVSEAADGGSTEAKRL